MGNTGSAGFASPDIDSKTVDRIKLTAKNTKGSAENYSSPQAYKDSLSDRAQLATESTSQLSDSDVQERLHPTKPPIKVRGQMHKGGTIPETGLYKMEKGEKVIPSEGHAYENQKTEAMPNSPDAEGCGHWEIDGTSVKFVK
jgi:hypothetical protein